MASAQFGGETSGQGEFVRQGNRFTERVTADGTSGRPAEAGRCRPVVSLACPWAHRAVIVRGLLGLDEAISLAVVDPIRDERGQRFTLDEPGRDPVLDIEHLSEAYLAPDPEYTGRVTVPRLVDTWTGKVIGNDYPRLTLDLSTEWREFHREGAPELYPEPLRAAIDPVTEADVRLFTTLVRFDAVHHGHFKCNRHELTELPVLRDYARDLFQTPGFGDTVDFDAIKRHYYGTHREINPSGIVPAGPDPAGWHRPHRRAELGGAS